VQPSAGPEVSPGRKASGFGTVPRRTVSLPILGGSHPFVAYARTQSGGEVVTIGVSLWWDWLRRSPGNERLLRNLLVRPPRMR
jgi:hypothetical protein